MVDLAPGESFWWFNDDDGWPKTLHLKYSSYPHQCARYRTEVSSEKFFAGEVKLLALPDAAKTLLSWKWAHPHPITEIQPLLLSKNGHRPLFEWPKPWFLQNCKYNQRWNLKILRQEMCWERQWRWNIKDFSYEILYNITEVNLTKPEKRKVERKAKAHFDCPKVEEQVFRIWHIIVVEILIHQRCCQNSSSSSSLFIINVTIIHLSSVSNFLDHRIFCPTRWALQKWVQMYFKVK